MAFVPKDLPGMVCPYSATHTCRTRLDAGQESTLSCDSIASRDNVYLSVVSCRCSSNVVSGAIANTSASIPAGRTAVCCYGVRTPALHTSALLHILTGGPGKYGISCVGRQMEYSRVLDAIIR